MSGNTVQFDSNEERNFDWWLQELKELGYIKEIVHQPKAFELSSQLNSSWFEPYKKKDGGKWNTEELLGAHVYTPDTYIEWDESAIDVFAVDINSPLRKKKARSF